MRKTLAIAMTLSLSVALVSESRAAILYATAGSTYSQNFDSLPNTPENASLGTTANMAGWIDDTASPAANQVSIVGWYLYHPVAQSEGGFNGHQRMRIGPGNSTTGAFMSWGSSGSTERALGMLNSNTMATQFDPMAPDPSMFAYYGAPLHQQHGRDAWFIHTRVHGRTMARGKRFCAIDHVRLQPQCDGY